MIMRGRSSWVDKPNFGLSQKNNSKIDGQPKAKARFASKRPNGTINTHPQERMRRRKSAGRGIVYMTSI